MRSMWSEKEVDMGTKREKEPGGTTHYLSSPVGEEGKGGGEREGGP